LGPIEPSGGLVTPVLDGAGRVAFNAVGENATTTGGTHAMQLSARNVLDGKVTDVKKGAVAAEVQVDIGGGNVITSVITVASADRLGLKPGQAVKAVIKASEVIIGVED
jgi:molybdate transport system regulatory protein